jgi:hypothetical protein
MRDFCGDLGDLNGQEDRTCLRNLVDLVRFEEKKPTENTQVVESESSKKR